ncbi:MAG TPA: YgiT-type zinc finger protein [Tepidisphaeraceae bacterium]|jgi:YgiT-type zinc finger domain-containing protein|nr:YgiT-type zinc finger protein [Tepidisphaeraceae bacterium]
MQKTNNKAKYGRCENCGGVVVEKRLTVDRRIGGKLHEFEDVPVGVCRDCGQRIYKGPVLEQLERMARSETNVKKTIQVPVSRFKRAV